MFNECGTRIGSHSPNNVALAPVDLSGDVFIPIK